MVLATKIDWGSFFYFDSDIVILLPKPNCICNHCAVCVCVCCVEFFLHYFVVSLWAIAKSYGTALHSSMFVFKQCVIKGSPNSVISMNYTGVEKMAFTWWDAYTHTSKQSELEWERPMKTHTHTHRTVSHAHPIKFLIINNNDTDGDAAAAAACLLF